MFILAWAGGRLLLRLSAVLIHPCGGGSRAKGGEDLRSLTRPSEPKGQLCFHCSNNKSARALGCPRPKEGGLQWPFEHKVARRWDVTRGVGPQNGFARKNSANADFSGGAAVQTHLSWELMFRFNRTKRRPTPSALKSKRSAIFCSHITPFVTHHIKKHQKTER